MMSFYGHTFNQDAAAFSPEQRPTPGPYEFGSPTFQRINSGLALEDDNNCVICMTHAITHRLVPCNHAHFCSDCATFILGGAAGPHVTCPICRRDVEGIEVAPREVIDQQMPTRDRVREQCRAFAYLLNQAWLLQTDEADEDEEEIDPTLPWWPQNEDEPAQVYINRLTLEDAEVGLLPDTGAHSELCGDFWAQQQAEAAVASGREVSQKRLDQPRSVQGVGKHSQSAEFEVHLPMGMQDVDGNFMEIPYVGPCVTGSNIPGLWGITSFSKYDVIQRTRTGELWMCGEGENNQANVTITGPNVRKFQQRRAKSGHWLLPISRFPPAGLELQKTSKKKRVLMADDPTNMLGVAQAFDIMASSSTTPAAANAAAPPKYQ